MRLSLRLQLAAGNAEPNEDELTGCNADGGADAEVQNGTNAPRGVPLFWLTALCNEVRIRSLH